jgi:hypothetical protein
MRTQIEFLPRFGRRYVNMNIIPQQFSSTCHHPTFMYTIFKFPYKTLFYKRDCQG